MIEDLLPGEDVGADQYFDGGEFDARVDIEERHFWHVHRRETLRRELDRFPRPSRWVEFGCGIGTVSTYLNQHGHAVDYADIHRRALEHASERADAALGAGHGRRFLIADITRPLPKLGHGGALLLDVLEHLPDDLGALENVKASLDPGALIVVTVPAFSSLWSPWDEIERHKRRYTPNEVRSLLERAGLRVERLTCFFGPLFFAALAVKGLRAARGARPAAPISEMAEARDLGPIDRLVRGVLALERPILRWGQLPIGTSVLAVGRAP